MSDDNGFDGIDAPFDVLGAVTIVLDLMDAEKAKAPKAPKAAPGVLSYFEIRYQEKWWRSADVMLRVKDMTNSHRLSAMSNLERTAARIQSQEMFQMAGMDAPDEVMDAFTRAAIPWVRELPIYQSLMRHTLKAIEKNRT